ncbi:hypothetical protein EW026_g610 [Hermanssonia centrifuga]|uniref:AAA+ ATPase domain-containing protein n=1 Tax=Hermanssonia centrifuga TaxID=98765 RepID=A0A4S4KU25_9APHY|nr:hypothetical protein EW026_g610 [Hermanssonia centrifuga]
MAPSTRSSARHRVDSIASGSEYHASNASVEAEDPGVVPEEEEEEEEKPIQYARSSRGRKIPRMSYKESASEDELNFLDRKTDVEGPSPRTNGVPEADDEDEEGHGARYALRTRKNKLNGFIVSDEEGQAGIGRYDTRSRNKTRPTVTSNGTTGNRLSRRRSSRTQPSRRTSSRPNNTRRTRSSAKGEQDEDIYVDEPGSSSASADGSIDDAPGTSPEPEHGDLDAEGEADAEGEIDQEPEQDGRKYALRQRAKINYAIPPPLEEMRPPPKPRNVSRPNARFGGNRIKAPGWSASGAELSRWMGGDDSDSDHATRTPRKNFGVGASGGIFAGSAGAGGLLPSDLAAAAGTPSNLGKIGDASLADTDPLGVDQNVTFDEVGGLDDHINALKEMTLLPLLYPEIFQRFNLTPPRGVLFHGPPGTGKTLLARALAASCRSNGKGISFFMRKGADCLSKWVGEAERQLRLLFEEARNSQPSIIFFDEIDGLAPVRSSKQDQIHASIVSTLLALMDGMDGRGQVVVIGATNRPDAVDPALRRPGRFDREFYFPLPSLDARERILRIMTRKWAGWEDEKGEEQSKGLAKLTKGYGGADLRALCTEAALNAVQRRYPQIYKSNDRLLLQPESISIELRDFMISVKKMIPSSARATAPAASPLPDQLMPLLRDALERIKEVVGKVLPVGKKRTALEEAEWEDGDNEGALEREMLLQSMETLRVYRPRVVLHGAIESFHVQSLDLANLMSDSTRVRTTTEAAIVQLFVEAKRHQPSVIYIPSLVGIARRKRSTHHHAAQISPGPNFDRIETKFKRFTKKAMEEYNFDVEPIQLIETVTTTVEVHSNPNGNEVEVVNEERTEQVLDEPMSTDVDAINGINEEPVQQRVQPQPQLFDMDLEHMHLDLYKTKYLTPDDFLDDIRKIVHNTYVRANEDPERLFRAQAMLTAAEVSIQDFDPHFRLECQRMAARESKRREAVRKSKEKDRAMDGDAQNGAPNAPRRSARNNGQPLEISITDPLKLERRLKRQRSTEATAEPEEAEGSGAPNAKRSRVSSHELDGEGPLSEHMGTPQRLLAVRFVDNIDEKDDPPSPTPHSNDPAPMLSMQEPPRRSGFDPALLNPLLSPEQPFAGPSALSQLSEAASIPPVAEATIISPLAPSDVIMQSSIPSPVHDNAASQAMVIDTEHAATEGQPPVEQLTLEEPSQPPEPIEIERTPTPLPDFHVDLERVEDLKTDLRDRTQSLNVEQLEQLRAMCLACVWRHRSDWDRSDLVGELKETVREFVDEVSFDDTDRDSP